VTIIDYDKITMVRNSIFMIIAAIILGKLYINKESNFIFLIFL